MSSITIILIGKQIDHSHSTSLSNTDSVALREEERKGQIPQTAIFWGHQKNIAFAFGVCL